MRDFLDLVIAAAGIWCGWWACDIHHSADRDRVVPLLPYPVEEPPPNVLEVGGDSDGGVLA